MNGDILTRSLAKGQCLNDHFRRGEVGSEVDEEGNAYDDGGGEYERDGETLHRGPDSLDEIIEVVEYFIPKNDDRPDEDLVVALVPPTRATKEQRDGINENDDRSDETDNHRGSLLSPKGGEGVRAEGLPRPVTEDREAQGQGQTEEGERVPKENICDDGGEGDDRMVFSDVKRNPGQDHDDWDPHAPEGDDGPDEDGQEREEGDAKKSPVRHGVQRCCGSFRRDEIDAESAARRKGYAMKSCVAES